MTGSSNQTIDVGLHSRADQQDRRNDNHVTDDPGAQPREGKFVREPQIEGEKDERDIPVVTMPIESEKAIFRFSSVFMAFSSKLRRVPSG